MNTTRMAGNVFGLKAAKSWTANMNMMRSVIGLGRMFLIVRTITIQRSVMVLVRIF